MKNSITRIAGFILICSSALIVKTNTGGPGWSLTNAPITSTTAESNCTNCHNSFSLQTSGTNHGRINLTNNFTGSGYIPDSSYTLILGYKETGKSKFGFQMTCLESATYKAAGTFTNGDSRSQTGTGVVGGNTRYYIGHTSTGTATVATDSTTWRITWKAPSKNVGKVTFWVTLNVANGSGTNGDYIYSKSFTFSPSTLLPTAKAKITSARNCSGSNINFGADVTGSPTSYRWSFPSGTPTTSTSSTPAVSYTNPGTYKAFLTVKNSKGASKEDTLTFSVIARPTQPSITPGVTQNICQGDSVLLTTSTSSGVTYSWSPGGKTTRSLMVKIAGTYSVVVTSTTTGCSSLPSTGVLVNVNPFPAIDVVSDKDTQCTTNSIKLTAKRTNAYADSFSFKSSKGPWALDSIDFQSGTAGKQWFTAWVKSSKGCISSDSVSVQVVAKKSAPVLSVNNPTLKGFTVNWNPVSGATGYKVSLDSGKTFILPSSGNLGLSHIINSLKGGEALKVQVKALIKDACGETETAQITGTADTCKSIPYTVSVLKNRLCLNDKANITVKGLKGLKYGIRLNFGAYGKDTVFTPVFYGTSQFVVDVIDSAKIDCGITTKRFVIEEDTVFVPVTSLKDAPQLKICSNNANESVAVQANSAKYQDSVLWYNNGKKVGQGLNYTYTVQNGDVLYAQAKNKGGCTANSKNTSIVIQKLPDAGFGYTNSGSIYQFNANTTGGNHLWSSPVAISSNASAVSADFKDYLGQTVKVKHTIQLNGCEASDSQSISIAKLSNGKHRMDAIRLFPNPANNMLQMSGISGSVTIEITDFAGKAIIHMTSSEHTLEISLDGLPEGQYYLTVFSKEYHKVIPFTKIR